MPVPANKFPIFRPHWKMFRFCHIWILGNAKETHFFILKIKIVECWQPSPLSPLDLPSFFMERDYLCWANITVRVTVVFSFQSCQASSMKIVFFYASPPSTILSQKHFFIPVPFSIFSKKSIFESASPKILS